ncbi:ROK family protein [Herbiconiux ginsengi]|uniref:Sugar kinase of the NBD/HSP70 family, may contain an N-terminal HTH domain n=1 Tax=Herbiconiux ginsengi TaxID=381665 RepID=A0A1H3JRT4_9MICO|nr:ROK family protein [Herbiconiux ginsengi]SDY42642.1 Sugar kinase of the NBD/HSP70 family, may contain an N-terminal HTH domain [Herbiconiux ginsengi]
MRLGLDIGGTKTDAVAVDDDGTIVDRVRLATGFGPEAVIRTAIEGVTRIAEITGVPVSAFESVGIGIPGQVDVVTGTVSHAVNLGFDELDVGQRLTAALGLDVKVENDVKAAALGAYHLMTRGSNVGRGDADPGGAADFVAGGAAGAAPNGHSMAYLNLGTGLAAGLVIDGALWRGARGTAGEIGHIPVDPNGVLCPCGQRGCLETVASGSAIARQWATDDPIPARSLLAAADAGDESALAILSLLVDNVAAAVRVLVLTVDVEIVMIGGGLSNLGGWLLDEVRRVLTSWAVESPFLASLGLESRVQLVPAGFPAAAVGAALVGAPVTRVEKTRNTDRGERVATWQK